MRQSGRGILLDEVFGRGQLAEDVIGNRRAHPRDHLPGVAGTSINLSTKKLWCRIAYCIGGLDITLLNAFIITVSAGQNQMLPNTMPRTRSARSTATAMLIGPPQS